MLEDIRQEVLEACRRPDNVLTPAFYDQHLRLVAEHATALADVLGAEREIVELAAWLHDLSAVLDFSTLPTHAEASAQLAASMLARRGYPGDRIDRVAGAIRRHGAPLGAGEGTAEEVCVSNADAMSQIAAPAFWLFFAFEVRKLGFAEGQRWYGERVRQGWQALVPEARALIESEYALACRVAGLESGAAHPLPSVDLLRHTLATLCYRGAKAVRAAPPEFASFRAAADSRAAGQILAHVGDLLDWAVHMVQGRHVWREAVPLPWAEESERFFRRAAELDHVLASGPWPTAALERVFQGPIADALTHVGQINLLRRLAGVPVRGENYARAEIVAGRTDAAQAAPRVEFE